MRRTARAAVAALLVLVACGSSGGSAARSSTTATVAGGVPAVTDGTAATGASAPPGVATAPTETTGSTSGGGADSSAPTPGGSASGGAIDGNVAVGQFAPALLRSDLSTRVVVEVRGQDGALLRQGSVDHVKAVLAQVSGKPVSVEAGPSIPGGAKGWSSDDLRAEADAAGTHAQGEGGSAVVHLLLVHGTLGGDTGVLGVSVRGDVAVVFVDQVEASGSVLTGSAGIESAVVTHEIGHLLGLVDLVLHTGRQDPDHPGHSTNTASVMYWAVESSLVGDLLSGGPPQDFDQADLADLATIRG